jgi:hypothetical protein
MTETATSYQGNVNLKRKNVQEEYTEEQVLEIIRCKNDPIYFIKNYIHIINLDDGLVKFALYDYQERFINMLHEENRIIARLGRQSGKTTCFAAYMCHYIIFNENKTAAILGNKDKTAREILYRVKIMFENLPMWLKPGVMEWNKGTVEFENGSRIVTAATSSSAIRGMSINFLALDEFAFIQPGVFEDFIQSVYPTISTSKEAKILMVSTPWGLNHFYKFWKEAEDGKNGYAHFSIKWNDVPGRDDAWRDKMIAEIGIERFRQEFEAEFLGSSNTLIEVSKLRNMVYDDPISLQMYNKFKIFEKPKKKREYVMICDVAEGVGGDYSTVQVVDVTELPWHQVAVYCDNLVKTNLFASVINNIGTAYNNALAIVENNAIGESVLNALNFDHEYDNLIFYNKKFGMRMTKGSKSIGCGHLKTFIEQDKLIIHDLGTIEQFTYFERQKNGTFAATKGKHDDLITPFILFAAFMSNENLVDSWIGRENILSTIYSKAMEEIEENLLPVGFFPSSMEPEEDF